MAFITEFLCGICVTYSNLACVVLTISLLIGYWYLTIPRDIPGPLGLPVLGYLPFMGQHPQITLNRLAKKYGPVFRLNVGRQLVVILNDFESVKDAFVRQAEILSGRPKNMTFNIQDNEKYNIVTSDGPKWRDHRRFAISVFRDCGVGKIGIEPVLMNEIQHFINEIKQFNGQPKNFSNLLTLSVSNNICLLVFGKRFENNDPWFSFAKELLAEQVATSSAFTPYMFFPWLKHIPLVARFMKQDSIRENLKAVQQTMYGFIAEQKANHAEGQRDHYMSCFIEEQKLRGEKLKEEEEENLFTDDALESNMRSLMSAGTETTANTLLWAIICMILHPDIQKKVQKEIDEVIGPDRTPSWNDRLRTPYIEATIHECQRMCTLVPVNVPHRNKEAIEILGHKVPKDSFIVANLWAILNDSKLWGDPQNFRPERFLSPTGEVVKSEYLIPFSIGKRQCLGEILARMELYLYFTAMMQKFTFQAPKGTLPTLESRCGFTTAPKQFLVVPVLRSVG